MLEICGNDIIENKGEIFVSYRHPKYPEIITKDTIHLNYPVGIVLFPQEMNTADTEDLILSVLYKDGSERNYIDDKLRLFIDAYDVSINSNVFEFLIYPKNRSLNNDLLTPLITNKLNVASFHKGEIDQMRVRLQDDAQTKIMSNTQAEIEIGNEIITKKIALNYSGIKRFDFSRKTTKKSFQMVVMGNMVLMLII